MYGEDTVHFEYIYVLFRKILPGQKHRGSGLDAIGQNEGDGNTPQHEGNRGFPWCQVLFFFDLGHSPLLEAPLALRSENKGCLKPPMCFFGRNGPCPSKGGIDLEH